MSARELLDSPNRGTITMSAPPEALARARAELVYAAARHHLSQVRPLDPDAWLVAHLEGSTLVAKLVTSAPDDFVVVGRHARCDLRVEEPPAVSLRHALVRPSPGGQLEILGLRSLGELAIVGGGVVSRATLRGPVVALLAGKAVAMLPARANNPPRLPEPDLARWTMGGPPDRDASLRTIESLPATATRDGGASLTIRSLGPAETFHPSARDIASGIVIGRYDRCDLHGGARLRFRSRVSRVHALLLADGPVVRVYDLASSNGVQIRRDADSITTRTFAFDRAEPATFELGGAASVAWTPGRVS